MIEVLKFSLKGPDAIIRKPESNVVYFTYNNVHKIVLLGILGAIIGENGYNYNQFKLDLGVTDKKSKKLLPEFYTNLQDLKVAICPNSNMGVFSKKMQQFNNSVGYASKEEGNNLVVTEQYLENPSWDIYILYSKNVKYEKIKDYLINKKCEYIPYIGKNEHFANIDSVEVLNAIECDNRVCSISSIFEESISKIDNVSLEFEMYSSNDVYFECKEVMPTKLNIDIGYTDFRTFVYTNKKVEIKNVNNMYTINDKNIYFF